MTAYLKWGIISRLIAFLGLSIAVGSQWLEFITSSGYSTFALFIGFVLAFAGVSAGRGLFVFRTTYKRLEQEELQRLKQSRDA